MEAVPLTPAVSTRKTKNKIGFRGHSVAKISAPVFRWEKQWVTPSGMPEGSTYKVSKWVKTAEKVRFSSISADITSVDDGEDVDMDGDDREGEGDDQDDEEMVKGGDENGPVDISVDQDSSQLLAPVPSASEDIPPSSQSAELLDQQNVPLKPEASASVDDRPSEQPSRIVEAENIHENEVPRVEDFATIANRVKEDVPMTEATTTEDAKLEPEVNQVQEITSNPEADVPVTSQSPANGSPAPQSPLVPEATADSHVKLPDVDATSPPAQPSLPNDDATPMEVDIQQPLDRPEDSTDALALPVPSSIPFPTQATNETATGTSQVESSERDVEAPVSDTPIEPVETLVTSSEAIPSVEAPSESPALLGEETPAPLVDRSLTPSPSPERIQEFRAFEAAAEETTIVPGNLPSPSPQPEPPSITSPPPAPSNAVVATVAGSHITDVQFGGGVTGAALGEVGLEPSTHEPAAQSMAEVTMEGEADPGKSLGEGDPVGVNGEEEFGDEDVRRADAAPSPETGTIAAEEKATE